MIKFDAYLEIPMPSAETDEVTEDQVLRRNLYDTLDIFKNVKPINYAFYGLGSKEINFKHILKLEKSSIKALHKQYRIGFKNSEIIHAALCFSDEESKLLLNSLGAAPERPSGFEAALLLHEFINAICTISISLNIACPGSFEIKSSNIFYNDSILNNRKVQKIEAWELQRGCLRAIRRGWPIVERIDFDGVWQWVFENQDYFDGFKNNSVSRSLNAFSRLFENEVSDTPLSLLWSVIGIESLFSDGSGAIGSQVKEKVQVLIGLDDQCSTILNNISKQRAKFVHGKMDFPPLYLIGDARTSVDKYYSEIMESSEDASIILAKSIQEIVRHNFKNLAFKYVIENV